MNSKNNRYSAVNGMYMHYTLLHDVRVGVCRAVSATGYIWLIFFVGPYIHNHVTHIFEHRELFCAIFISNFRPYHKNLYIKMYAKLCVYLYVKKKRSELKFDSKSQQC